MADLASSLPATATLVRSAPSATDPQRLATIAKLATRVAQRAAQRAGTTPHERPRPASEPAVAPAGDPVARPTRTPTTTPSETPTTTPSETPSATPSATASPTARPTPTPTLTPEPTPEPTPVTVTGVWAQCGTGYCVGEMVVDLGGADPSDPAAGDYDGDGVVGDNAEEMLGLEGMSVEVVGVPHPTGLVLLAINGVPIDDTADQAP